MNIHRFIDTPLALHPAASAEMLDKLKARLFKDDAEEPDAGALAARGALSSRSYDLVGGVAIIPVSGVLVHGRASMWDDEMSYGAIASKYVEAIGDADVNAIALQISSPGGEVSGLFDLAETIYSLKSNKLTWAILDDSAYSAAYALASTADKIVVPRTGGTGSIGVISMHLDISKMLENFGVNATIIQYGARKSDYSMMKPLSEEARARLQAQIDSVGEMFVELVARNRGLARTKVRSTEAATYMGKDGVEQGLADAVMAPQDALAALMAKVA